MHHHPSTASPGKRLGREGRAARPRGRRGEPAQAQASHWPETGEKTYQNDDRAAERRSSPAPGTSRPPSARARPAQTSYVSRPHEWGKASAPPAASQQHPRPRNRRPPRQAPRSDWRGPPPAPEQLPVPTDPGAAGQTEEERKAWQEGESGGGKRREGRPQRRPPRQGARERASGRERRGEPFNDAFVLFPSSGF